MPMNRIQRRVRERRTTHLAGQLQRFVLVLAHTQAEHNFLCFILGQQQRHLDGGAGVQAHAQAPGQPFAMQCRRIAQPAIAAQELRPAGSETALAGIRIEEGNAPVEFRVVGIACREHAVGVLLAHDVHLRFDPQVTQHPLHVAGGR
ncbi:hypothetical protein D3C81_1296150 [compost metagenome]